jgi:hypothetical protein
MDWEKEGVKMADIYSNAVCNISFLYSPDDDREISHDPRVRKPCVIRPALGTDAGIGIIPQPYWEIEFRDWGYWRWTEPSSWPLSSRAWAYQEYLLNRRTLFYGHNNFLWECAEQYCDQSLGFIKAPEHSMKFFPLGNNIIKNHIRVSPNTDRITTDVQLFDTWVGYISEYRRRALTVHSDRVMAFAGIAQAFAESHNLTYLAGHFWEHMPYTLMWFCTDWGYCKTFEDGVVGVPSWSWFSARVPISLTSIERIPDSIEFDPSLPDSSSKIDIWCPVFEAQMVEYQWPETKPHTGSRTTFTSFTDLSITLKAALFSGTIERDQTSNDVQLMCEEIASLHRSAFTNTGSEIFDYSLENFESFGPETAE